jgi:nicotinate-nucleotide adenylyltransferase
VRGQLTGTDSNGTRRVGVLGGTFDPIHRGHLDLGLAAERALGLTDVLVVTANIPPHRSLPAASGFHRFAMTALAVADVPRWQVSDVELLAGTRSFTTDTLQRLHDRQWAPSELYFIIGADAFADIATWKDYPAVLDRAHFAVVSRPRSPVAELPSRLPALAGRMTSPPATRVPGRETTIFLIDAPTADVSSTAIRGRLAEGGSIAGLVPALVGQHIDRHRLYASPPRGGSRGA